MTGGCSVGGRRSWSGGLAETRPPSRRPPARRRGLCRSRPGGPLPARRPAAGLPGRAAARSRGLSVEAVAARVAATSTTMASACTVSRPCTARAGPICQRPGRTARSRISSTVVRIGPAPNADLASARCASTISSPLNGRDRHLHRHGRVADGAQRVGELLAHRHPVLVHRRFELRPAALQDRGAASRAPSSGKRAVTSPSLRRRALVCMRRCCSSRVCARAAPSS